MKRVLVGSGVALITAVNMLAAGTSWYAKDHTSSQNITVKPVVKTVPKPVSAPKSYHVGDTQTDGQLSIKLLGTKVITPNDTGRPLPSDRNIFEVLLQVTNDTNFPIAEGGQGDLEQQSIIYIDKTGFLSSPQSGALSLGNCVDGALPVIGANQTVNTCVEFAIKKTDLVDTYFYKNLKWYL